VPPAPNRLMIALVDGLNRSAWSGRLPNVNTGEAFWAPARNAVSLVAAGQAEYAPDGTVAPPPEPPNTVHGTPGFAAGTSNSSH
jgi:hypothetical protein